MLEMAMILAQAVGNDFGRMGLGIGIGLIIVGAGLGIGRIGGSAVDAMSRQPEAGGRIQTAMIIAAALIEGATVIALVFILLCRSAT
jgi:F-type H+-transporting ATPase subunit c